MTILEAILPPVGILLFFAIALRALLQADRRERAAAARFEREQRGGTSAAPTATAESSAPSAVVPESESGVPAE